MHGELSIYYISTRYRFNWDEVKFSIFQTYNFVAHTLGKVNSLFALTENLMPLLYIPLYTKMYSATMEVLPGAVFMIGAVMTFPAIIVFSWLFYEHRTSLKKLKNHSFAE
ncbi:unnamed protein product, partial [Iphiclides podalirius]